MKRITVDLECSHTATVEVVAVPAQPNHLHADCGQCHGQFAALRVTNVEDLDPPCVLTAVEIDEPLQIEAPKVEVTEEGGA
jgi:hypothetical protein